jgi:hypothetical protein
MIKSAELAGPSCLTNAADDEPLFVLRANDECASMTVREWAWRYFDSKLRAQDFLTEKQGMKYREALALADQMDAWRVAHAMGTGAAAAVHSRPIGERGMDHSPPLAAGVSHIDSTGVNRLADLRIPASDGNAVRQVTEAVSGQSVSAADDINGESGPTQLQLDKAEIARLRASYEAVKRRADNHAETLRGIAAMNPSTEGERMRQWAKDALSGYTESAEATIKNLMEQNAQLRANLDKALLELHHHFGCDAECETTRHGP